MTSRKHRTRHLVTGFFIAAALALTMTAYGAAAATSHAAVSGSHQHLIKLHIAMVPVLDAEPLLYAKSQGYYKDAGLDVTFSSNDAGAAVVTGVVNGTYDAAAAAWFPVAIAISKGVPLRYMMAVSYNKTGSRFGQSGIVVKPDSGISSYKDLEGKTVATNALTSLINLSTKMRMKAVGADPDKIKFVALPFKTSIQAVTQGQVDAAVTVVPFPAEAQAAGLKVIGDPLKQAAPPDGPILVMFTSKATAGKKAKALAAFTKATFRAQKALEGHWDLQREIAQNVVGLPADIAHQVRLPGFMAKPINLDTLQKQLDHAYHYGYLARPVKAKNVVLGE